jgi:hypothetical protein
MEWVPTVRAQRGIWQAQAYQEIHLSKGHHLETKDEDRQSQTRCQSKMFGSKGFVKDYTMGDNGPGKDPKWSEPDLLIRRRVQQIELFGQKLTRKWFRRIRSS